MNKTFIATYGTLRTGQPNHDKTKVKSHGISTISRYKMYSMGGFPALLFTGEEEDRVKIEVLEIKDINYSRDVDMMELRYGYYISTIDVGGKPCKLYCMTADIIRAYGRDDKHIVKTGDWLNQKQLKTINN